MSSSGDAAAGGRGEPNPGGEQQRRLLQQWGLQSAPASQARPPGSVAPKGAVVGEALVLSARELRLVLTLLLVMFMTGEAWRYVGAGWGLDANSARPKPFVSPAPPRAGPPAP